MLPPQAKGSGSPGRGGGDLGHRPALADLKRVRVKGHAAAEEIVTSAIPAEEAPGRGRRRRVFSQAFEVRLDKAGFGRRVVVEQDQHLTGGRCGAEVDAAGESEIASRI